MTEPDSLTEHNAAIEEALEALADAALDCHGKAERTYEGTAEDDWITNVLMLCEAADDYHAAVEARAEWRAKVRLKPKAGGWPT